MNVTSNYSTLPVGQPKPNAALQKLPVVVREKIEGARLPVQYDEAVKALAACTSIDESKHWADKAEALAAWAKVYKDDQVAIEARRLKLHAYRRMGQLAEELRPTRVGGNKGYKGPRSGAPGNPKGAKSLLRECGLKDEETRHALNASRLTKGEFKSLLNRGASVSAASRIARGRGFGRKSLTSDTWAWLTSSRGSAQGPGAQLFVMRSRLRSRAPHEVAAGIAPGEVKQARELAIELIEWLDAFEQALPKDEQK